MKLHEKRPLLGAGAALSQNPSELSAPLQYLSAPQRWPFPTLVLSCHLHIHLLLTLSSGCTFNCILRGGGFRRHSIQPLKQSTPSSETLSCIPSHPVAVIRLPAMRTSDPPIRVNLKNQFHVKVGKGGEFMLFPIQPLIPHPKIKILYSNW